MRFLLINPPCPLSEQPSPPLGLSLVAAALEEAGVEVEILDFVTSPYRKELLAAALERFRPDIVGAGSVTMTFNGARDIIRDVRTLDSAVLTVMGGAHVTFCAEETLREVPELDLVVRGEGERTVVELVRQAGAGRDWSRVPGLSYRDGDTIRRNDPPEMLDIDSLPMPARHLLPLGRYRALNMCISLTTSRGCPFPCIFCVGRKMLGKKVRYRDPQKVVDELEYLAGLGFPQVNIADDLFTAKKDHCNAICDEILRRGIKVQWSCFARVDTVSVPLLRKIKEAGCATVGFGVESANAEILRTIRKKITIPKVVEAIEMCVEAGLQSHVSFILGLPGETPETIRESLEFCKSLQARGTLCGFHLLAPFPGTAVRDENDQYDVNILTEDWSEYHANRAIVSTAAVEPEMMNEIVDRLQDEFDRALGEEQRRFEAGELPEGHVSNYENLQRTVFFHDLMMSRAIEDRGTWTNGAAPVSDGEALRALAARVCEHGKTDEESALRILTHGLDRGYLRYEQDGDQIRWTWNDHLEPAPATP